MSLIFKDRVKETTSTTGTGDIVLAGAADGYQAFSAIGDGNTTYYCIVSGNDWEVGIGTYTLATTTLSRDTILDSSTGSAISLSGTSTVFCTYAADKSVSLESNDKISQTYIDYDPTIVISPGSSTRNVIVPTGDYVPLAFKASASQSTNLTEWQNSSSQAISVITSAGRFSSPTIGAANAESFGAGSIAQTNSVCLGNNCVDSSASGRNILIGKSVTTDGVNNIAIGTEGLTLGSINSSIILARGDSLTGLASNQCVIGGPNQSITNIYIGKGPTNSSPEAITFNATGGNGTNIAGADINIAGGIGTGTGVGGNLNFKIAIAGSSGSSANTLSTVGSFSGTTGGLTLTSPAATTVPLTITLAAAQSANAITVNNSSATTVFSISSAGAITTASSITASGTIIGGNLRAGGGGYVYWANRCLISSPIDSQILMTSSSTTDFGRLQFGGTTSSYPSIKRNGAGIDIRLADDSNYANLAAANLTSNGNPVGTGRDIYNLVW